MKSIQGEGTKYGFKWGALEVDRLMSDQKKGWVVLRLKTAKEDIQVYVTKTGKVRIYGKEGVEWEPQVKKAKSK